MADIIAGKQIFSVVRYYSLFLTVIAIAFFPVVLIEYATSDMWSFFFIHSHPTAIIPELGSVIQGGRPVYFIFLAGISQFTGDLGALGYVRAFAILGVAGLVTYCFFYLRSRHFPLPVAMAIAVLLGLMPSFQVYVSWAICAPFPWAALLAAAAFGLIDRPDIMLRHWTVSAGLLVVALSIYQPAAMMFWVLAGISWVAGERGPSRPNIVYAFLIMGFALSADFLFADVVPFFFFADYGVTDRATLANDIPAKVTWFFQNPMMDALNLPAIEPRASIAAGMAFFIVSGLWFGFRRTGRLSLRRLLVAAALLPLSYLPNLIVAESWSSYRTQVALTSLILVYFCLALQSWLRLVRCERWQPYLLFGAVVACAISADRNVLFEWALPQSLEYRQVSEAILKVEFDGARRLYLVPSQWKDSLARTVRYDEFGYPSSASPWAAQAMAWQIFHAQHLPLAAVAAYRSDVGSGPPPDDSTIIDFGKILRDAAEVRK